jgi:hypothetical protein
MEPETTLKEWARQHHVTWELGHALRCLDRSTQDVVPDPFVPQLAPVKSVGG